MKPIPVEVNKQMSFEYTCSNSIKVILGKFGLRNIRYWNMPVLNTEVGFQPSMYGLFTEDQM
jgi:hypothetical protein